MPIIDLLEQNQSPYTPSSSNTFSWGEIPPSQINPTDSQVIPLEQAVEGDMPQQQTMPVEDAQQPQQTTQETPVSIKVKGDEKILNTIEETINSMSQEDVDNLPDEAKEALSDFLDDGSTTQTEDTSYLGDMGRGIMQGTAKAFDSTAMLAGS